MFERLNEFVNSSALRLNEIQKAVLLTVFVAETPQLAFDATVGSERLVTSRKFLAMNSLISMNEREISITPDGYQTLLDNGLIDDNDKVTSVGNDLVKLVGNEKYGLEEENTEFRFIKNLLNI